MISRSGNFIFDFGLLLGLFCLKSIDTLGVNYLTITIIMMQTAFQNSVSLSAGRLLLGCLALGLVLVTQPSAPVFAAVRLQGALTNIPKPKVGFVVTNPSPFGRSAVPVTIGRAQLVRLLGPWQPTLRPVLSVAGKDIPSQTDDLDGNGNWDELAFELDLGAKAKAVVTVQWVDKSSLPVYPQRTQAYLGVSKERNNIFSPVTSETRPDDWKPQAQPQRYQMEGPGWENDVIAFRSYFDARNGKDIFSKTKPDLIIDKIGIPGTPLGNYHKQESWGMDILKVGESLGAGAIGLAIGDSLYHIGQAKKQTYQLVAQGPVRSIIRLVNIGWAVPVPAKGESISSKEDIVIWAGKYWYENQVTLSGFSKPQTLITGVTYVHHPAPMAFHNGPESVQPWVATHAKQSENNDILGLAAIFPKAAFVGFGDATAESKRIKTTYYAKLTANPGQTLKYRFVAGWELSKDMFGDPDRWKKYVQDEADEMANPFLVSALAQ